MADEHVPTREVVGEAPVDPLIGFYWARLDEREALARSASPGPWRLDSDRFPESIHGAGGDDVVSGGRWGGEARVFDRDEDAAHIVDNDPQAVLDDVAAKKAILDDYARYCADVDNPARELICRVTRDVIKRLATVHAGHPDYDESWRP